MSSRVMKYQEDNTYTNNTSRTLKNANLYRQVYGKYENKDNLPIDDNTSEIDMKKLKELVTSTNNKEEQKNLRESLNILDTRKRKIDEQKVYDINKILEKAKNENNKLKEPTIRESIINKDMLSTLESRELSLDEIKKASSKYEEKYEEKCIEEEKEPELTMTREFKFKELSKEVEKFNSNPLTSSSTSDNDLSFDLFEELKPTGNTIVTKPIVDSDYQTNIHSSDTKDIDIIKSNTSNLEEFFTSSYEFSKKDFAKLNDEDDDFFEIKKSHNGLKIFLLILAIIIFASAIFYFIKNYGLGL